MGDRLSGPGRSDTGMNRNSWLLAAVAVVCGVLTFGVGSALALMGMGFANPTAAGTGLMGGGCGILTVLAARGLGRRRRQTMIRVGLAWGLFGLAVIVDWPATVSTAVIWLFLAPALSMPIGLVWSLSVLVFGVVFIIGLRRCLARRCSTASVSGVRWSPGRVALRALPWIILLGVWQGVPPLWWHFRGREIQRLTEIYATAPKPALRKASFGACTMVFLGYELTQHGAESAPSAEARRKIQDRVMADATAELVSLEAAGARYVRVGASGDHLLVDKPDQEHVDDRYLAKVKQTGIELVLVDTQHPKITQQQKMNWSEFCRFQRQRIEYYLERYQPEVYFVVCEPLSYHRFVLTRDTGFSAEAWVRQLSDMCRLVKALRPETRSGICLLVMPEHLEEWAIWSQMRDLPELDILAVEIYAPEHFSQTEARLEAFGHPRDTGKRFWIAETYNGWALCGQRRWDQDAAWLRLTASFAGRIEAETVLVWSFGTFIPGGSVLDFGHGRLDRRWRDAGELSLVGKTFSEL